MIEKFVFRFDESNKQVLHGVVENELDGEITFLTEFDYVNIENVDEEGLIYNYGGLCYVVFEDDGKKFYLDLNIFNNKVKINLTDKVMFATPISESVIDVVLEYLDVNLKYEIIYSGVFNHPKKGLIDSFDKILRTLYTDSYIQIFQNKSAFYLTLNNNNITLTKDIREAFKFKKKEIRNLLVINKFLTKQTEPKTILFSPYRLLRGENEFILFDKTNLFVKNNFESFELKTTNFEVFNSHLLSKSEIVYKKMKEILNHSNSNLDSTLSYIMINDKYVSVENEKYFLTNLPAKATTFTKDRIDLFQKLYSIFSAYELSIIPADNFAYLYTENNEDYELTTTIKEENGLLVGKKAYLDYISNFSIMNDLDNGYLLISNDQFLSFNLTSSNTFNIKFEDSSYNATLFTKEQAKILSRMLRLDFVKLEITNLFKNLNNYNISNGVNTDLIKDYELILNELVENKYKVCMFKNNNIKIESEKGSIEYLRKFYYKTIKDAEIMFEKTLNDNVKHLLLVESYLNLELIALNNVCVKLNKTVTVTLLNTTKTGYFPKTMLSNVVIKAMYKVPFHVLPKQILNKCDLIFFAKRFNEENISPLLNAIKENQDVILVNYRNCNLTKDEFDPFINHFKLAKRKHFPEYDDYQKVIDLSRELTIKMFKLCKCSLGICEITDPIVNKEFTYHSILKLKRGKIYDYFK